MNVFITRQPIFERDGSVYAYKLLYSGDYNNVKVKASEDENADSEIADEFFGIDVKTLTGGVGVFICFTDEMIRDGAFRKFSPDILVIEVTKEQLSDENIAETLQGLKERGYKIAFDGFEYSGVFKDRLSLCDIVKVDIKASKESLEETANVCRESGKLMLAKNVNTIADAQQAKNLGCTYLQGYFFVRSANTLTRNIQPLPVNLIEVMQLMAQPEPEINDIVDVMSRDTALCQKILKLINSVYFGVSNKVSSINQAILVLGLDYLREWVYLMGMQKIAQNDNVEAMRVALLIAKFCRKLSGAIPEAANDGDAFYLMGLLSMIVLSSDRALAQALDEFPLTTDIKKGLLRCGGIYSDVFEAALSYLDGRWEECADKVKKYGISSGKVSEMFIKCTQEIGKLKMG